LVTSLKLSGSSTSRDNISLALISDFDLNNAQQNEKCERLFLIRKSV
jgi:hypothetical protein